MGEGESGNKRIAKNTLLLYGRMFVTLIIGLYTSREILNILGASDYGLYNIVGGVVSMMGFLTASLTGATSRFITIAIAQGDNNEQKKVFGCLFFIHIILAVVILFLGETIGLWFINGHLNIPLGRDSAAFWVFQCSLCSAILGILTIPYNSVIIANEKLDIFAFFSIIETLLKLVIVLCLPLISSDKLVAYALLFLLITIISRGQFIGYTIHRYGSISMTKPIIDRNLIKRVGFFSMWTMFGHISIMAATQGLNILLNIFFGTIVNAARAIAVQVQNIVMQFCYNFQMALNPQLTKSYAQGNINKMHNLLALSSKLSFYLLLLLILPIVIETERILTLWLKIVPEHTIWFVRIILCQSLVYALSNPLQISIQATGNVKKYQLVESVLLILVLPLSYVFIKFFGASPEYAFVLYLIIEILTQIARTIITLPQIDMPFYAYVDYILKPIILVLILSPILPCLASYFLSDTNFSAIITCILCLFSILFFSFYCGCSKNERNTILELIYKKLK